MKRNTPWSIWIPIAGATCVTPTTESRNANRAPNRSNSLVFAGAVIDTFGMLMPAVPIFMPSTPSEKPGAIVGSRSDPPSVSANSVAVAEITSAGCPAPPSSVSDATPIGIGVAASLTSAVPRKPWLSIVAASAIERGLPFGILKSDERNPPEIRTRVFAASIVSSAPVNAIESVSPNNAFCTIGTAEGSYTSE